jgi:hypothetical protein
MFGDGLALTLLSLEDLPNEFVLRATAHLADPSAGRQAWAQATSTARDQCGNVYLGDVLTACPVASGLDLGVSFSPALDPRATVLELTLRLEEAEWTRLVPLLQPESRRAAGCQEAPLSPEAARLLELAERAALLLSQATGSEHLLLAIAHSVAECTSRSVLEALNLTPDRIRAAVEGGQPAAPRTQALELLAALKFAARHGIQRVTPDDLLLGLLAEPGTRVEHVLSQLGLTRQLVFGLASAYLETHPSSTVPALTLRRVAALAQSVRCDDHTLTLMSLEDHVDGFVVRTHFDSARVGLRDALANLRFHVYDERGQVQSMQRAETAGHGTEDSCALDVTWRSSSPLPADATVALVSVPWLRLFVEFPLAGAQHVRYT